MTRWPKPAGANSAQAFNELSVPGGLLPPRKVRESHRNRGWSISINGRQVGTTSGIDALNAMIQLWAEPDPVSGDMKRLLLGGRC
jgi:hypothetical protein